MWMRPTPSTLMVPRSIMDFGSTGVEMTAFPRAETARARMRSFILMEAKELDWWKICGLLQNLNKFLIRRLLACATLSRSPMTTSKFPQNNKSVWDFFDDKRSIFEFPLSENSGKKFSWHLVISCTDWPGPCSLNNFQQAKPLHSKSEWSNWSTDKSYNII